MPEGNLTSVSSSRYLPDKTAGRNNLNEWESNAVLDDSQTWTNQCLVGQFCQSSVNSGEFEYVWTGEFDMITL